MAKEKTDLERFQEFVKWVEELVFGTPKKEEKPKRARGKKGRYKADDKSTPDVNEAWVGGKEQQQKIDNRDNLMKKMLSNRYEDLMADDE